MSEDTKSRGFSENLLLDDSARGVVVTGITDDAVAAKSGLQPGDEIVAATIHLDHLKRNEVLEILKVLEPYDDNMKIVTKKDLQASADLGSLTSGLQRHLVDVNSPAMASNDVGATLKMPSVGLTGPEIKNDLQGDLKLPDGHGSLPQKKLPKFTMPNFHLPPLKKPKAEMDVSADVDIPTASANLNATDFNLPKLDHKEPNLDINGPNLSLNSPDVNTEPINIDIDEPPGKFKWPHLKWKHPKVPEAGVDADIPAIDADISMPNIQGSLDAPGVDVNLPNADIKGPAVDAKAPHHGINARFGQINWPHLKWKKVNGDLDANLNTPSPSALTIDGDINAPDIDADLPEVETDCPDLDMPTLNADVQGPHGKINWPHLKWKKRKGPKADLDIDATKNMPNLNLQLEEPNLPTVDADLPTVNADLDAPSAKFAWPHFKWKKPVINGPKTNMDIDADMDINAGISKPEGNVSVKASELELNAPDGNLDLPKAGVHVKDIEPPSTKLKWPTFKKRKRSVSGPKIKDLDADLDMRGVSISAPEIEGGINATGGNINLPKVDFDSPKVEVNAEDVEGPSGKFKLFKKPIFGTLKTPKADLGDAHLGKPELALDLPELSGPKVDGTIDTPELNITSPKADVDADLGSKIKIPKLKLPSFKGLKPKTPELENVTAPDIDASCNVEPDMSLSLPNIGNIGDAQDIEVSHSGLSAPTIAGNLDRSDPKLDLNLKDHFPKLNLPTSKIDVPVSKPNLPSLDVKGNSLELPKTEIEVPDVNLKTESGLNLSVPKTGEILSTPSTEFSTDVLEAPDVELKASDMDIDMPDLNISDFAPTADVNFDSRLGEFKSPQNLLQFSKLKPEAPSFDPSVETGIEGPKVSVDSHPLKDVISLPKLDLTPPKGVEVDEKGSKIDINPPQIDVVPEKPTLQNFNLPTINFSPTSMPTPGLNTTTNSNGLPDVNVKSPGVDKAISPPSSDVTIETKLSPPELEVSPGTEVEVRDSPKSKLRLPFKWGFKSNPRTDEEGGGDSETDVPNEEDHIPEFKCHTLPKSNVDGIDKGGGIFSLSKPDLGVKDYVMCKGIRLPIVNATTKTSEKIDIVERLKMAKEKLPISNSPSEATTNLPLARGDTFKVEKSGSVPDPDERDKLSLSLSNMLGLNTEDSSDD